MQFGIRAANYPFIADDMDNLTLPAALKSQQSRLFGLTIDPERLNAIREELRENSRYASLRQCRIEVAEYDLWQISRCSQTNIVGLFSYGKICPLLLFMLHMLTKALSL